MADVLKRIALLNTALFKVVQGTRLVRVLSANYERGRVVLLVEAEDIHPPFTPASVEVKIEDWFGT